MSFIAKNPLTIPKVASAPPTPQEGARGLFAGDDGWYDIDSDGNVKKIALSDDNISYADCDNDLKTRIDYSLYDDHFVAPTPQEDFVITYRSIDNTASIHAYVGNDTDIVVPYICYKDGAAYIVTALQPESFQNHDTIVSVALPNTITRIDAGAFLGCSNLSSINIPNGVNLIAGGMFSGCESLTSIIIPANVRAIATLAFYGCTNLATITMPGDISVVGDEAFWGCHALTTVYYNGNKKQWSEMTVGDDNDSLLEATIVFSMDDYALADDLAEVERQLSRVYKPKGSCASLPTQNNQIGDVWNLLYPISAGSIQLQATKNETIIVPTSRMTYSSEYNGSYYFHTFSILFLYEEFPEFHDSNYRMKTSGLSWDNNKVSLTMEGISFDSITYEDFHISPEENGYKIVFREFSQSAVSEFQRVASEERTVTQIKIPHENRTDFPSGSNVVWVEPGYWDMLAPTVDLSRYVALNNVSVTDKNYSGDYIKHAREINISTKKAENLVTAEEIDNVLSTEIQKINSKFGGVFHYKGSSVVSDLPKSGNTVGDVWNISKGGNAQLDITSSSFVVPYGDVDYDVELQDGVYHHTFWFWFDFSDIDYIGDKPGWHFSQSDFENIRVKVHNYEPLKYVEDPGGSMEPIVDLDIKISDFDKKLSLTFSADSESATYSNWQEMYSSGTAAGLPIDFVITPYISDAFEAGSNVVWAEPGYWDVLSPFIDLSNYVTKTSYANSSVGGVVKVESNTHGLNMDSGTLKISPATAAEISLKANGYKPVVPAQIENAVAAGTHQSMSDSYNVNTKGNLPASYTAVKGYVDSSINNKIANVYKPKGSWTAIDGVMPSNNEVGDVWNLTNTLNAEEMRFGYISNNTITVPTNHMSYSRTENNSQYTHTFSILIPYEEFPAPPDTNYKMINSGVHSSGAYGISITMEDIAFDDIPYETWHIVAQPDGYEMVFVEFSASSTSEFETVASTARTITQVKVPYTNTHQILAGNNIVWVEPGYWDVLSGIVDLSGYATISYIDNLIGGLEDTIDEILTEGV